jgi:hypothetical protein
MNMISTSQKTHGATSVFQQTLHFFSNVQLRSFAFGLLFLLPVLVFAQGNEYAKIYWPNYEGDMIERIQLDGNNQTTIINSASGVTNYGPVAIAVDIPHGKIYWFEDAGKTIQRADLNGSNRETIVNVGAWVYTLYVDVINNYLYWPNYESDKIERSNLDGTNRVDVITGASGVTNYGPIGITVDAQNSKIYWFEDAGKTIQRANLNGSNRETIVSVGAWVYTLYVDKLNAKLYWPNYEGDKIERSNLDGTNRVDVVTGASGVTNYGPIGITVDVPNSKIYWFEDAGKTIQRADFNGSNVETLVSVGAWAYNLVIPYDETLSTLPVTLTRFTAARQQQSVLLNWQTASEQNAQNFVIQHSTNGQQWKQVGIVAAAGNSTAINNYQFTHNQPVTGNNYYRLLQLDKNGATTYSTIEAVQFAAGNNSFTVTSNTLTNGLLRVVVTEPTTLRLFTGNGQLLQQYRLAQGNHTLTLSAYAKGIYFINGNGKTERLIIQ